MALSTNVHIRYRTPYLQNVELPDDVEKVMRSEITKMRKDLIRKQQALKRSKEYTENERLLNQLQELRVRELKTKKDVQNTWNRLRSLEYSNETSVSGKNEQKRKAIQSFHMSGFSQINYGNYNQFTRFLDKVKNGYQALLYSSEELIEIYFENYQDPEMRGMNDEERFNFMIDRIVDEMENRYRMYDSESKYKQQLRKTVNELNKTEVKYKRGKK